MSLVHVNGHQKNRRLASTLTSLEYINIQLYALEKQIMAAFVLLSAKINAMVIELSDLHGMPSVSINGSKIHSNISQSIAYKIYKRRLPRHWDYWNLTHTADWEEIYLT